MNTWALSVLHPYRWLKTLDTRYVHTGHDFSHFTFSGNESYQELKAEDYLVSKVQTFIFFSSYSCGAILVTYGDNLVPHKGLLTGIISYLEMHQKSSWHLKKGPKNLILVNILNCES